MNILIVILLLVSTNAFADTEKLSDAIMVDEIKPVDAEIENAKIIVVEKSKERKEAFEVKIPYEIVDDYGNKATFFRKEIIKKEELEDQEKLLEANLQDVKNKLIEIEKANK